MQALSENMIMAESIDIELAPIINTFRMECALPFLSSRDEALGFAFEANGNENEEESSGGGLLGIIKRIWGAVVKFIKSAGKKLKSIIFGAEVNPAYANKKVKLDKDPEKLAEFIEQNISGTKDMLNKLANGNASVEDCQNYSNRMNSAFAAIGPVVMTLGGLAAKFKVKQATVDKWQKEVDTIYANQLSEENNYGQKYARSLNGADRAAIAREGAQVLAQQLQQHTEKGIFGIYGGLDFLKKCWAENYLRRTIAQHGESLTDRKAAKKFREKFNKAAEELNSTAKTLSQNAKTRDKEANKDRKAGRKVVQGEVKVANAVNDNYDDKIPTGQS